jgi:hypothetical protein
LRLYERREISVSIEGCWFTVGIDSEGEDGFRGYSEDVPFPVRPAHTSYYLKIPVRSVKGQPCFFRVKIGM